MGQWDNPCSVIMPIYLSLSKPVIDDVHEPNRAHRIPHLAGKLYAALRSTGLRDVNNGQIGPVDCKSKYMSEVKFMTSGPRNLRSSVVGGGGTR